MKVRNIGRKQVPLASGMLQPGEEGDATGAEIATLSQYIRKVELINGDRLQRSILESDEAGERQRKNVSSQAKSANRRPYTRKKQTAKKRVSTK